MKIFYLSTILIMLFSWHFYHQPETNAYNVNQSILLPDSNSHDLNISTIASGLNVPWEILWGPDSRIWITEQKGLVSRIDPQTGSKDTILQIADVWHVRTAGLLGMVLHPDMKKQPYVFLNYTFFKDKKPYSRLVRYNWNKDTLVSPKVLLEIPGNNGHNGSRLAFSKGKLFWATGDAITDGNAQNIKSLNGKILRINIDGSIPRDNPIKGSLVWATGFRNMQGLVFSNAGMLYSSEHGEASDDEINLITEGRNYGWPTVQGYAEAGGEASFKQEKGTVDPLKTWTPTIGPAGLDYYNSTAIPAWNNSLLLVTLKGRSLRSLKLSNDGLKILREEVVFEHQYGRLRDLCISPAGDVYISTSNHDWNTSPGFPVQSDDRIIKISASAGPGASLLVNYAAPAAAKSNAAALYLQYCGACHKEGGTGLQGVFPPLKGSEFVHSGEEALIRKILNGSPGQTVINGIKYDMQMPAFAFLKNEELAEILTYVRSMTPAKAVPVSAEKVNQIRGTLLNK